MMVPQMMECQRADNDMHGNHSQAAAMQRTNILQPARQFAAIIHGDLLLLPTLISRTSCAMFVSSVIRSMLQRSNGHNFP
jgi:hypothetical protein